MGCTEIIGKLCFSLEMAWFPKRQLILCAEQSLQINLLVSVLLVVSVMPSADAVSMYGNCADARETSRIRVSHFKPLGGWGIMLSICPQG